MYSRAGFFFMTIELIICAIEQFKLLKGHGVVICSKVIERLVMDR